MISIDSESPVMVVPSMSVDSVPCGTFTILTANCSSWDEVTAQPLIIPITCDGIWSRVILTFTAQEEGTQYDRFGAIWIGDIEVLRTTTAEPTSKGLRST